jgi:hypothetical protein
MEGSAGIEVEAHDLAALVDARGAVSSPLAPGGSIVVNSPSSRRKAWKTFAGGAPSCACAGPELADASAVKTAPAIAAAL